MNIFIRAWQEQNIKELEKHLFIIGDLTGECFACHTLGIPPGEGMCPSCGSTFRFIGFRRKVDPATIKRFITRHPDCVFIEFEDFKRGIHKDAARRLLDI